MSGACITIRVLVCNGESELAASQTGLSNQAYCDIEIPVSGNVYTDHSGLAFNEI